MDIQGHYRVSDLSYGYGFAAVHEQNGIFSASVGSPSK